MARPRSANASRKHARSNPKNRSLNAFSIAEAENEEKPRIAKHRFGDAPPEQRKRRKRDDDSDDDEDEDDDDEDMESDGEGHRWRIGVANSDEDSELDSDEAFGESDEEKFAGYSFAGSSSSGKEKAKKGKVQKELDLEESEEDDDEESEGENGEGWMDISEALDTPEERAARKRKAPVESEEESSGEDHEEDSGSEEDSEEDSESDDDAFDVPMEDGEPDLDRLDSLHSAILALPTDGDERKSKRQRLDDPNEGKLPSEYNLSTTDKLTLDDLLPTVTDPKLRKPLNTLQAAQRGDVAGKLAAPLSKRMQDRLDRAAAYEKSKKELEKWTETVKNNREADHLVFPLPGTEIKPDNKLPPTTATAPLTSLEEKISEILQASNMVSEKKVQEFEELKTNRLSVEEVQARTAQMRLARELLFREEIKAKRLKKIKSKAYRRLKKRERTKAEQAIAEAMELEGGGNAEEDEEEAARKRAEARMSLRFKQSKWAKGVKDSGRGMWDDEAREGAIEMSKREEELRRRIQGKDVHGSDSSGEGELSSEEESEADSDEDDEKTLQRRLLRNLDKVEQIGTKSDGGLGSRLMGMKFMQQAEAAKKQQNQEEIEAMRKEFEDDKEKDSDEEDSDYYKEVQGRRKLGPVPGTEGKFKEDKTELDTSSSESDSEADDESEEDVEIVTDQPNGAAKTSNGANKSKQKSTEEESNPWLVAQESGTKSQKGLQISKGDKRSDKAGAKIAKARRAAAATSDDEDVNIDPTAVLVAAKPAEKKSKSKAAADSDDSEDDDVDAAEVSLISAKKTRGPAQIQDKQRDLARMAFAGDDVVRAFKAEKKSVVEEEGDKVIDTTLPGWVSRILHINY